LLLAPFLSVHEQRGLDEKENLLRREKQGAQLPEAAFLDVIGTKVLRVFLLAIHSHLYYRILF
jgi:hypothetical protein